jgi:hypothetical protein
MKCQLCGRRSSEEYCVYHAEAYQNILKGYPVWSRALSVSWFEYLAQIRDNKETGIWALEVAEFLLKRESSGSPSGYPAPP